MTRIPNLFRVYEREAAAQLYEKFIARLMIADRHPRIIEVCRRVRRYARGAGASEAGDFTYPHEIAAYGEAGDYPSMWRILRAWERSERGQPLKLSTHKWRRKDASQLKYFYAPILYLRAEYALGRQLLETALALEPRPAGWSYEAFSHVYSPVHEPQSQHDVALCHFYQALGISLSDWPLWDEFAEDLHPKLLRLAGLKRNELRSAPRLMARLSKAIRQEKRKRLVSGATHGQRDLTEPAGVVRRRQRKMTERLLGLDESPQWQRYDDLLRRLFPELTDLPPEPSFRDLLDRRKVQSTRAKR